LTGSEAREYQSSHHPACCMSGCGSKGSVNFLPLPINYCRLIIHSRLDMPVTTACTTSRASIGATCPLLRVRSSPGNKAAWLPPPRVTAARRRAMAMASPPFGMSGRMFPSHSWQALGLAMARACASGSDDSRRVHRLVCYGLLGRRAINACEP
jgi:hypothetical protein